MLIRAETCRSGRELPSALISQQIIFIARQLGREEGVVGRSRKEGGGRRRKSWRRAWSSTLIRVPFPWAAYVHTCPQGRHNFFATHLVCVTWRTALAQVVWAESSSWALMQRLRWPLLSHGNFSYTNRVVLCVAVSHTAISSALCVLCTLCVLLMGWTMCFILYSTVPACSCKVSWTLCFVNAYRYLFL